MKTLITHFYNEEYLLPWWLNHHKNMFDVGILIDYGSTDRSVEIIKQICPNWQIFPTANHKFDASAADREVEFYESQVTGWKIALTIPEFLVGDLDNTIGKFERESRTHMLIPEIRFVEWDMYRTLDHNLPLWKQLKYGVTYHNHFFGLRPRSMHTFNMVYPIGRHFPWDSYNTEDMCIFHYAHCIVGHQMLKRKLQIQDKISDYDKQNHLGWHHHGDGKGLTAEMAEHLTKGYFSLSKEDCSAYIQRWT